MKTSRAERVRRLFAFSYAATALVACGGGTSDVTAAIGTETTTSPATAPAPAPATTTNETVTNWVALAAEGEAFSASGTVRYGYGLNWVTKTLNGNAICSGTTFGGTDPAPGAVKVCEVQVSAKNVVQTGLAPVINTALMAPAMKGYSVERVGAGDSGDVSADGTGAFRTNCSFSHFAFDDPIVYPGQPGKSHLHTFFGNSSLDSSSTVASVANSGNSSCMGGTVNRTGYWIPALVDLKTGAPIVPTTQIFYYKSAYLGVKAADVKPFPSGLRIIAGDSSNKTPLSNSNIVRIICQADGDGAIRNYIPNCAVGATIEFMVMFPQCWDGVNLDSPDHKSHMAYATGSGCPSTHPVALPEITFNVAYLVTAARPDQNWKLSSDNYSGPGGYSMHADWFGGWKTDVMNTWVTKCINPAKSSSGSLCDGKALY